MSAIQRENQKKLLDKYLKFPVFSGKQEKIANLLLKTPCTCPKDCDRHWLIDHPDYKDSRIEKKIKKPRAVAEFLTADYTNLELIKKRKSVVELPASGKFIIFSDLHQGAFAWSWDEHDFFWKNKELYRHILDYYFQKNYTLMEIGDIEEFWLKHRKLSFQEQWQYQRDNFADLYALRQKFNQANRFIKIRGNHDNIWAFEDLVKKYLHELLNIPIYEFAILGQDFLIMHGHQIDPMNRDSSCKKGRFWTKVGGILEFFKDTELFGHKKPDKGWKEHPEVKLIHSREIDHDIYKKAVLNISYARLAELMHVYLIVGHNHAPKCLPEGDLVFNTGCGVFEGIVFGIEVNFDEDLIRVVDWNDDQGLPTQPIILCEYKISELRRKLSSS